MSPAGSGANLATRRARLDHDSWQVYTTYLLTGEHASCTTVVSNEKFAVDKPGWGPVEVALGYSELDVNRAIFSSPASVAAGG